MNKALSADARATLLEQQLTLDEKIGLLHGHTPILWHERPADFLWTSGYVSGVPRLDVPALRETDAGLGVTHPLVDERDGGSTVLPSGLAEAATWNPELAREGGAMLGLEAHENGFNVVLAPGINLARDPRGGRNFEYAGEDPLLAGVIAGNEIAGIQSQNEIATLKHYALNDQETGRFVADVQIDGSAARESDLLAFELAIERGAPGSIMCAYNKVGGVYACENADLLNATLKADWAWPGFVMSDWGATHSTEMAAINGLDQEDGEEFDGRSYFAAPLEKAVQAGTVPQARFEDMVHRILRTMFQDGVIDLPAMPGLIDYDADGAVSQRIAEQAIVLLKNANGRLPLTTNITHLAVIGGHADLGVLGGGGGSSEVVSPHGGTALSIPHPEGDFAVSENYLGVSPLAAILQRIPNVQLQFNDGTIPEKAAAAAKGADVVIVFATQWTSESVDAPNLSLPANQDAVIEAVAAANPHTIVVLETSGPVLMPWIDQVEGVVEAWYSGSRGGEAIARVLFGEIDPSGRLAITFPMSEAQLPHPQLPGYAAMLEARRLSGNPHAPPPPFTIDYFEGANVGYRWYESRKLTPLFPFGFGLSYTTFAYSGLKVEGGRTLSVSFDVKNTGMRPGFDTPEIYAMRELGGSQTVRHLIGWNKVLLNPGETRRVSVTADPRLLATFDMAAHVWKVAAGPYRAQVGRFAGDTVLSGDARLSAYGIRP
ncbi:MAG TPA: glycoside hydrolase family 3 C-terminal domain-containing protein [Rhizomicrobium sp.]|nr:glycoside hydrolase family 3 C-terminal domain-containing protein [Rhizomicrobium sp.]